MRSSFRLCLVAFVREDRVSPGCAAGDACAVSALRHSVTLGVRGRVSVTAAENKVITISLQLILRTYASA